MDLYVRRVDTAESQPASSFTPMTQHTTRYTSLISCSAGSSMMPHEPLPSMRAVLMPETALSTSTPMRLSSPLRSCS